MFPVQLPAATANILIVGNTPFSVTLADSYRAGIERGFAWTLCVDADVLVLPNAIFGLLDVAHTLPAEACDVQGLVLDKFFGVRRPAGNHLYRTSLLSKALGLIPPEGQDIRPENSTLNKR